MQSRKSSGNSSHKGDDSKKLSPFSFKEYTGSITMTDSTDPNSWYLVDDKHIKLHQPPQLLVPKALEKAAREYSFTTATYVYEDPNKSKLDRAIDEQIKRLK